MLIIEGFGGRVVAPVHRRLGHVAEVVSPRGTAAIERLCAASVDLASIQSPPFHDHVVTALDHGRMPPFVSTRGPRPRTGRRHHAAPI